MVLKLQQNEFGCMECGRHNDSTKKLSDGMVKIPIVMKNMFSSIVKVIPLKVNDITISSLLIMGK